MRSHFFFIALCVLPSALAQQITPLRLGDPSERLDIRAGDTHQFEFVADSSGSLECRIEHADTDISITVGSGPDMNRRIFDLPLMNDGYESAIFSTQAGQRYTIDVTAKSGSHAGSYRVQLQPFEKASPDSELRFETVMATQHTPGESVAATTYTQTFQSLSAKWRQRDNHFEAGRMRFAAGAALAFGEKLAPALNEYAEAAEHFRAAGRTRLNHKTRYRAAATRVRLRDYEAAREDFTSLLAELGDDDDARFKSSVVNYIALTFHYQGHLVKARERYAQALALLPASEAHQRGTIAHNIAGIYYTRGEGIEAIEHYERALEQRRIDGDPLGISSTIEEIGAAHVLIGRCDIAISRFQAAIDAIKQLPTDGAGQIRQQGKSFARIQGRIGACFMDLGDLELALDYLNRSRDLFSAMGDRVGLAAQLVNLGTVRRMQGDYGYAQALHREAIDQFETVSRESGLLDARLELIADLIELSEFDEARALAEQTQTQAADQGIRLATARLHHLRGRIDLADGAADSALRSLTLALNQYTALSLELYQITVQSDLAKAHFGLGQFEDARRIASTALNAADVLRAAIADRTLRATFQASLQTLHDLQVRSVLASATDTGPELASEAWYLNALQRGKTLRESRQRATPRAGLDNPSAISRARYDLTARLARLESALQRKGGNPDEIERLTDEVLSARLKLVSLANDEPVASTNASARAGLADVIDSLGEQTLMLDFAMHDEGIVVWSIDASGARVWNLRRAPLAQVASLVNEASARAALEDFGSLLAPILAEYPGKSDLVIVPDGQLGTLPLAMTPIGEGFLIQKYSVSLVSDPLLRSDRPSESYPEPRSAVLIGDPVFTAADTRVGGTRVAATASDSALFRSMWTFGSGDLARLPYSADELAGIAETARHLKPTLIQGLDARKQTAIQALSARPDIAHFATHGFVHERYPELSGLALAAEIAGGTSAPPDFLSLTDIRETAMAAGLVVLSGCDTAVGPRISGEGPVSLAREFMLNGSSDVVASIWKVSDSGTSRLMQHFYRGLLHDGLDPAKALAEAQRAMLSLKKSRWSRPIYWAGFVHWRDGLSDP